MSDEQAIKKLVADYAEGWTKQSGSAFAKPFAEGAYFTDVFGRTHIGREIIAKRHDELFASVYKRTQVASTVERVTFIRPDVASVRVINQLQHNDGTAFTNSPHSEKTQGKTVANLIAVKEDERWSIQEFHNMIPVSR